MRSKLLKTIAILVIIVMVFELTPSIVLGVQKVYADEATKVTGEEATKITNGFPEPPLIDEGLREPATIIGENVSKRTLNEKHYILDNGAMLAAVYPSNVHYEKNGELVDIDNTLIQAENTNEYTNKDNDFKVNLAKQTTNGNLIKIEKNGHKVSWSLAEKQPVKKIALQPQTLQNQSIQRENANELSNQANVKTEVIGKVDTVEKLETINISEAKISTEKINMNKAKINTNDEKMQLEKINSSVKYAAILNGVDLKYDIASNSIKESIILRNKNQICTEFTFNLETNGLKARLEKDKTVILYNEKTNEDVFIIEAPYMFDSKLEYSDDIEVELLEKNGKYQLIIKPEEEWLIAEERAYPVTIDPTVSTSLEREKIKDTYVYDGDTNNNTRGNAHIIRIGNSKWLGPNGGNPVRGLIKFELPKLDAGDQVIYATLGISNYPKTSEWTPPTRELQIDVHKMTANWDENTAHWSNTNTNYDTRIADYILYQYNSSTPNTCYEKVFDITAIAKDWYTTGNNYGVMLKEHTEQRGYTAQSDAYFVSSDTATTYINARPQVMIEYRNQTGVENYLSYHEQNVGRAGTIYTNDYNGNLVLLHGDLSTPGNRMPVGINHVFNTNDKSTDIGYGKGYRLNLSQTINPKTIGGTAYLRYVDEDGTAHYFKKPSGASHYEDEDGLGLKITLANNIYTMEDKKGNKSTFSKHKSKDVWYLTKIQDTNGNAITLTLTYTGSNEWVVSQVTDAVGDKLTLTYSGNRLANIKDPAGKTVTYTYNSNGNLTQITYPDGLKSNYAYSDNKLTSAQNIDNSKVQYEYYVEKTSRVKTIKEYGTDGTLGNTLTITYGSNTTKFVDNKGYSNIYSFNNLGQVTSIGDFGKSGNNTDTAYGKNFEYGSDNNKHNMTLESNLMSVSEMPNNLVKNGNFNSGLTNWSITNGNGKEQVAEVDGNKVLKVTGEAKLRKNLVQSIPISNGKKGDIYNIAGWIKTYGVPHFNTNDSSIRITVGITKTDGKVQWGAGLHPSADSIGWQFVSGQFITEADYKSIEIYLIAYFNANDTYFDNIGLFKDEFGASYAYDANGNMISTRDQAKNSSTFEYNANNNITKAINPKGGKFEYTYNNTTKNLTSATNAMKQKYSFGYDSYGNQKTAKVEEAPKTDDVVNNNTYNIRVLGNDRCFDINQGNAMTLEQHDFHGGSNQKFKFQQISGESYYRIIPNNDTGKSLELNTSTNKIQQITTANKDTQKWQLTKNTDGTYRIWNKQKGNGFVMTLENDRSDSGAAIKIEKWLNKSNQKIMLYNTTTQPTDTKKYIQESAEYTSNGKFKTKDIDQAGNATTYTYNNTTGTLTKVTNAKQTATQYTYDNIDRLTKVEQTANSKVYNNQYTYEKDRLKTISHNGFNYQFIYDNFGNTKQVKVGNATLITNNYEANNGNLTSITYGNNQTISYTRDRFNRITKTTTPAGTYEYSYDAKSNLKQAKDNVNSITETYKYDLSDRLVERNIANGLKSQYTYDKNNNVSKITTTFSGTAKTTNYWYDRDNRINYIDFGSSRLLRVNYDRLSRITDKTLESNGKTYVTKYQYKDTSTTNKTTTLLESMQNGTKAAIKYTYDAIGNIETITEGTTLKQKYYYDALNQLIREDNKDLNKTITYEYDTGGNILNKKEYAYTTGTTLQNPTSVVEYAYGNTNWKDQLTSYNGKTITYDAIGNPLTYDGNTYTWKNGRELGRIQNTSKNTDISYKYNDSGIRIEKTVNGTTTKYHLDGTKVIYEQTGSNITRYMHDEAGQVIGMEYNGTAYYYVKNGQGDVIGLLDNNLNEVARYTYDSWGKVISVTNSVGNAITDTNNIAHKNPYRYRGYRYDTETGLYYLQSRYYNPEWGRFVNADRLVSTGQGMFSHNMYVYCENNCVNFGDATGTARKPIGFKPFGKEIPKLGSNNTITRVSVTNNSKKLPDYSKALNKLVQKNIAIAEKKSPITDTIWFYEKVNHEGDWDYKRKNAWEAEFKEPFLGYNGKFLWNGKVTTAEQFGNIHYGIVGTAMGYSPFVLYSGGGVAKLGLIKYVLTAWPPYWGDDSEDHYYIKQGINMYNSR